MTEHFIVVCPHCNKSKKHTKLTAGPENSPRSPHNNIREFSFSCSRVDPSLALPNFYVTFTSIRQNSNQVIQQLYLSILKQPNLSILKQPNLSDKRIKSRNVVSTIHNPADWNLPKDTLYANPFSFFDIFSMALSFAWLFLSLSW